MRVLVLLLARCLIFLVRGWLFLNLGLVLLRWLLGSRFLVDDRKDEESCKEGSREEGDKPAIAAPAVEDGVHGDASEGRPDLPNTIE